MLRLTSDATVPSRYLSRLRMLICPKCNSAIPDTEEKCLTCGYHAGPPNVRAAERAEETRALEERYQRAFDIARTNGCLPILEEFNEALKQSSAVINVDLPFLFTFITNEKNLYTTYERGVAGKMRKPAAAGHDRERRGVGGTLFGGYADEIRYAALSLDGSGPQSYGPLALKLREITVEHRATVLENNSYEFRRKHNLAPGDDLPPGYTATWANRHKLAVAKLAGHITPGTSETDFPRLLLSSVGDRATDEFIEVLIFGTFDLNAVESVKGSSTFSSRDERDLLRMVKQHLRNAGKEWIEG